MTFISVIVRQAAACGLSSPQLNCNYAWIRSAWSIRWIMIITTSQYHFSCHTPMLWVTYGCMIYVMGRQWNSTDLMCRTDPQFYCVLHYWCIFSIISKRKARNWKSTSASLHMNFNLLIIIIIISSLWKKVVQWLLWLWKEISEVWNNNCCPRLHYDLGHAVD